MAKADLARVSGQNHQADTRNDIDEHQADLGNVIVLQQQWRKQQH